MLMRTDPVRGQDVPTQALWGTPGGPAAMPVTAHSDDDTFVVHVGPPGVSPRSIDATVGRTVLTIRAGECSYGTFSRQPVLGDTLAVDHLTAAHEAGVLTLTIPIPEPATPRRVEIGGREGVNELTA